MLSPLTPKQLASALGRLGNGRRVVAVLAISELVRRFGIALKELVPFVVDVFHQFSGYRVIHQYCEAGRAQRRDEVLRGGG